MSTRIGSGGGTKETSSPGTSTPAAAPQAPQAPATQTKAPAPAARPPADGVEYGFTAAKGPMGDGVDAEILGASAKFNWQQWTVEGAAAKGEWKSSGGGAKVSAETFSFKANLGTKNADGSVGNNIGFGATIVGAEGTWNFRGGNSVTAGVSAGVGAEVSTGVRDVDQDGKPELCLRVSVLAVTAGVCFEELVP